ncbi:DNA-binding protein [Chlorobium sp. N1]|nr:DNA-binding protein [Chlorobium sp. N1]
MNTASSFDNLPQEVRLLHQKLEVIAAKIDTITSQAQKPDDTLIGVDEAAKLLGISKGGIYSKVYRNIIPYYKSGGKLYFSKQELLQEIFAHRYPKPASPSSSSQIRSHGSKYLLGSNITT